jgi:hypothetical protein
MNQQQQQQQRLTGGSGGNVGSGGGGGYPPNELFSNMNYLSNDTNRQILLLLMRLQQDTNNVLTRLSYLEATVMSIQVRFYIYLLKEFLIV